jgi:predicted esterase
MNRIVVKVDETYKKSGEYLLSTGVIDDRDSLRWREDMAFFVLVKQEYSGFKEALEEAQKEEMAEKDEIFRESLPTLEIRFDWMSRFMEESNPYAALDSIKEWLEEVELLVDNLEQGKPALFPPGSIGKLAHRSEIDGTLQPYSVYLPEFYDPERPIYLWVSLHGSGVDGWQTVLTMARVVSFGAMKEKLGPFIVMTPKARGLSDWYLADSGKDVMECIDHIKKLFNINERVIILDGFSMGGYGAWRIGLLNPGVFRAVIIRSGAVSPPSDLNGENIIDLLDRAKGLNLFFVHGDQDNAVPVENARKAAAKLDELGLKYTYLEVEGGAHSGYDKWKEIFDWLKMIVPRTPFPKR